MSAQLKRDSSEHMARGTAVSAWLKRDSSKCMAKEGQQRVHD